MKATSTTKQPPTDHNIRPIDSYNDAFSLSSFNNIFRYFPISLIAGLLERYLKITWLNQKVLQLAKKHNGNFQSTSRDIADEMLSSGAIRTISINNASIPSQGSCIIVAPHDGYLLDCFILLRQILKIRNDIKFIANKAIKENKIIAPWIFPIDLQPGKKRTINQNASTYKKAIRWLRDEKLLIIFPESPLPQPQESEHNHSKLPWSDLPQRLAEASKTQIIPLKITPQIHGAAKFFQRLCIFSAKKNFGKIAQTSRNIAIITAFRQYYCACKKTIFVTIGKPIMPNEDIAKGNKLRDHVYQLDKNI